MKLREKDLKLLQYDSMGLTVTDAAKLCGMTRTNASLLLNRKLNKFKLSQDFKLAKKGNKIAHKIADDFLTEKTTPDGKMFAIKASDALKVVEMVQDRIDPVTKFEPGQGQSITFTQVNINLGDVSSDLKRIQDAVHNEDDNL